MLPGERSGHLLLWVRTGLAQVRIDETPAFALGAGEGVWIPPGQRWTHGGVVTEPGTVAFPLWLPADVGVGELAGPTRFDVPAAWQDWLIQHFNLLVTPLAGRGYAHRGLVDLLGRGPRPRPLALATAEPAGDPVYELPPMPRGGGARAVAEELVRDPAIDLTVEQWAARVLTSPRTLRRDFRSATGLTFEQWRLRCRLSAGVDLLIAGYGVDQVASRVGFAGRSGFTRAFKQQFGTTPHGLQRRLAGLPVSDQRGPDAVAADQADDLVRIMPGADQAAAAPREIAATRTASHVNDIHVLSWMYRGSGYLQVGERTYERQRGVATWIPAGLEHTTGLRHDSISLPIGDASTADLHLTEPLQVRFSPAWDDYLMFCSVSARSWLRPEDHDPTQVLELFSEQIAARQALSLPMPTDQQARAAATDFLRTIGATGEPSSAHDLPSAVHRAFRDATGMTFPRWRYAARMRIARDLLTGGAKPSAVARRVGYAHLSTFSAAFTRFHGISPRDYQENETERSPGDVRAPAGSGSGDRGSTRDLLNTRVG